MTQGKTTGEALWALFVEDGGRHAERLLAKLGTADRPIDPSACAELAAEAYVLANLAMLMGIEDIGRLALACEDALDRIGARQLDGDRIAGPVRGAAGALADAMEALARPGSSGALVPVGPLGDARRELARALADARGGDEAIGVAAGGPERPAGAPGAAADDDGRLWVPQVDEDMIDLFVDEASEKLEGLSSKLLALEERPDDGELVREVFRDLHTVKGSSGIVGLKPMNRLAHAAEDLVGQLRDGARRPDRAVVNALLAALDTLREILGRAVKRAPIDVELGPVVARLRAPTDAPAPGTSAATPAAPGGGAPSPAGAEAGLAPSPATAPAPAGALAPGGVPAPGGAPALGGASAGDATAGARPAAAAPKQTIRVDFDKLDQLMNLVGELILGKSGLNVGLLGLGSLARELDSERRLARRASAVRRPSTGTAAGAGERPGADRPTGEGDPARAALRAIGDEIGRVERVFRDVAQDLDAASERLDHVSADLRDQVMKLRMVPISGIFRKHLRTVRDLAQALGKQVRLELEGEETELDKVLVEQLDDPLMHLVRNAVDHGVEPPEARVAAGKPAEAVVRLRAYHRGNQIAIELQDDGAGIDPARLRRKAREKGLVTEAELASFDEREVLELIFRPGFSTAAQVTNVSGRGVGMDVVRETVVSRLKGTVDLASVVGRGTTFTLRLPLTLAIIQVVLLRAGGETFAVPLDVVTRTFACRADEVHQVYDREVLTVRGRQVPLIRLRQVLGLAGDEDPGDGTVHVVLVEAWGQTYGLACDRLLGKQEIVIKTLGDVLEDVPCASGATLLGERCAIILDVPAIVNRALRPGRGGAAAGPVAAPAGPEAGAGDDARTRVLLVEDSETTRAALKRLLVSAGYEVTEARDGLEGLRLAEATQFDLISTDVMMPRMDGYELTRALRAEGRHRDTPIVMVTARGEKIDQVRGFDAGVDAYITKPHDREEFVRQVARCLADRRRAHE